MKYISVIVNGIYVGRIYFDVMEKTTRAYAFKHGDKTIMSIPFEDRMSTIKFYKENDSDYIEIIPNEKNVKDMVIY